MDAGAVDLSRMTLSAIILTAAVGTAMTVALVLVAVSSRRLRTAPLVVAGVLVVVCFVAASVFPARIPGLLGAVLALLSIALATIGGNPVVHRADIGDHLGDAVDIREFAERRVGCPGRAMAAMVMGVDMEAASAEKLGEAGVARRMLGQAMVDLDHGARMAVGRFYIEVEVGPGR